MSGDRERKRIYNAAYHAANREKHLAYMRAYAEAHRDELRIRRAIRYAANHPPVAAKRLRLMADCHPDRPHMARGLCASCYGTKRRNAEVRAYERRKPLRECDICARGGVLLVRLSLVAHARKADGRPTSRGSGAITLCQRCWAGLKTGPVARRPIALRIDGEKLAATVDRKLHEKDGSR